MLGQASGGKGHPTHRVEGRPSGRREQASVDRQTEEQVWGRQVHHGPLVFSWFYFTTVSNTGNVGDVFCQNSRRQSNNQNFPAVIYWIKFLVFPVSIPLPFDTSVSALQCHLPPAYKKNFRKLKRTTIFTSQKLSCISSHNCCCYFLARAQGIS